MSRLDLQLHELDVVSIQSGGLRKSDDGTYASTLYTDSDNFGMLGGYMRVLAAQELYWHHSALPFVFCNGKSAKQIAKFGSDVPTDAEIYADEFRKGIAKDARSQALKATVSFPKILLEGTSVNTVASISELITLCGAHGWKHMGLVSSDYHIPRIEALCNLIFEKLGARPVKIACMSAETILKELRPGQYNQEIDAAYQTPTAHERIKNERTGCDDIASGRYHIGEFQLASELP